MLKLTVEQIRAFRLQSHHLDRWYDRCDSEAAVGACGMQNSPPGAWQLALANRIEGCTPQWADSLLEEERILLQAWSIRGVPLVFPTKESGVFLTPLTARPGERWIYTRGADLALTELGMGLEELLALMISVMVRLDDVVIETKSRLDEQIADWIEPLLPPEKRTIWNQSSMYDPSGRQLLGEALVSFLLRPCSFLSLVVFSQREGDAPSFTSYRNWIGHPTELNPDASATLVKKFLHCYGPATQRHFTTWLGCSPAQGARLWKEGEPTMEAVKVGSQTRYILREDLSVIIRPVELERTVHLLSAHDPYLGLQDREIICTDRAQPRIIWQTVANPGAIIKDGEVVGQWRGKKRGERLSMELTLWGDHQIESKRLEVLAHQQAEARGCELEELLIHT